MEAINLQRLERLRDVLEKHQVEYLVIGKTAAILQGYPDTTQDVDLFIEKDSFFNGPSLTRALRELGFELGAEQEADICGGRALIQLRSGPFDVDLVFAPDGIDDYETARRRGFQIHGYRVCALEDVIASKAAANRAKDREVLRRLRDYARYRERVPLADLRPVPPRLWLAPEVEDSRAICFEQGKPCIYEPDDEPGVIVSEWPNGVVDRYTVAAKARIRQWPDGTEEAIGSDDHSYPHWPRR